MAVMLSFNLSAKTVKFQCNNSNAVMLITPQSAWGNLPVDSPVELE